MNGKRSSGPPAVPGRLLFASIILLLVIAAGCTMKKPVSVGCCVLDNPESPNTECGALQGADSHTSLISTQSCNVTGGVCDITVKVTLGDAETESQLTVPICSDHTTPCISSDCIAQACGSLTYNPLPMPSARDASGFKDEAGKTGQIGMIEESRDRTPLGLYGAVCSLQATGEALTNYLQNSKGSFINTLRFGVGESFEEFDRYRWLFPISDVYCNANPIAGSKDRYMNYLLSPDEFEDKMAGSGYQDPAAKVQTAGFCLQGEESPFLGETYDGSEVPDYRYAPVLRVILWGTPLEHTLLDKEFYINFLTLIYEPELRSGLNVFASIPEPAPFECSSGVDCASGYCSLHEYNRMLCRNTLYNSWVLCGCDAAARSCLGQSTSYSFFPGHGPDDAEELEDYLQEYLEGERFVKIEQLPVGVVQIAVNPSCTAGNQVDGIKTISVKATVPLTARDFIDSGAIVPTPEEQDQLDDCESSGDWSACDYLLSVLLSRLPPGSVAEGEIPAGGNFPGGVIFFPTPEEGYIGYSLLSETRFWQTDFFRFCGPSYDIVLAEKTFPSGFIHPADPEYDGDRIANSAAKDAVRQGKLFVPPSPIPEYLGWGRMEPVRKAVCKTGPDEEGYFQYVPRYILIKDTGMCEYDQGRNSPTSVSFGWCEPCSYSTLAPQQVTAKATGYTPFAIIGYTGYSKINYTAALACQTKKPDSDAPDADYYCPTSDDPDNPYGAYDRGAFNALPDSLYLQEKQSQYLKESVMPVLDLTDSSNWGADGTLRLNNTVIDRGPSILVVQKLYAHTPISATILKRIDTAKKECPSCLIAVEFANSGAPFAMGAGARMEENIHLADLLDPEATPGLLGRLDMVMISFYPNEYTSGDADACSLESAALNEKVFMFLENQTRSIMMRTQRPVMVTGFGIKSDGCWDQTEVQQFISYLFLKQKQLSRVGMAGLIFTDVSILTAPGGDRLPEFCALEKGSHNLVADEPATLFTKAYATPPDQTLCSVCSDFDIVAGLCETTCINGVGCTVNEEVLELARNQLGLPDSVPDSQVPLKCAQQSLPEPCTPCSDMAGKVACDFFMSDGSVLSSTYDIDSLTVLEADIIASIPPPYACCLADAGGNYTFVKQTSLGRMTAPLIYSPSGDPRQDCGIADMSAFEQPLCDVPLPIKNHRVECRIVP